MEARLNARLEWADTAKGIGIIAVVVAHTALDFTWWGIFINSFHMPLFFFLSGLFFRMAPGGSAAGLIRKRAARLLVPYFVFAGLSYLYFLLRYHLGFSSYYDDLNVYQVFFGIFYSAGLREWMDFNLPLWFLTCLFVTEMLFLAFKKTFRTKLALASALVICAIAGYLDGLWNPVKLPWGIDVALTAVVFFGAGHLLKDACAWLLARPKAIRLALGLVFLTLNLAALTQRMNLNAKAHGQFYDFYFAAFCGIAWCLLLSSLIRWKALTWLGRNALILLAVHMPLLGIATRIAGLIPLEMNPDLTEALRAFITILMAVPIIHVITRYFPWMLGRGGLKSRMRTQRTESEVRTPSNTTIT
jgi:fucose 4-O-acetylase-like acetyltransferase